MSHVVSPKGWLTVAPGETLYLLEPFVAPQWRALDVGRHSKTLTASIVSISHVDYDDSMFCFQRLNRKVCVSMRKTYSSYAPLHGVAHDLLVACLDGKKPVQCDLSLLLYLAHPFYSAEYASRIFRLVAIGKERVKTWEELFKIDLKQEELEGFMKRALDTLSTPAGLKTLYELAVNPQPEVRANAYKFGLWTRAPGSTDLEPGRLTLAGALSYLPVAHLLPRLPPCDVWPTAVRPKTC